MALAETMPEPDLLARLEALAPVIRQHAAVSERERRLAPPVAEALRDAGFFRMFRPRARGGLGLDPVTEFRVGEALARIDSAAAWNVQVCNAGELYGGWFSDEATEEIFGPPETVMAGAFNPPRRAIPADGGYRVTGRTSFNSNCQTATWSCGLAQVYEGDAPRLGEDGQPVTLLTALRLEDLEIVENWDTLGMCGTGSHDLAAHDVFVPGRHAVPFGPLATPSPAYDTPLARLVVWGTVGAHASVALGVAQAAIDALTELGARVPAYTESALRDRGLVQSRRARAEGVLNAARAGFHAAYADAWETARHRELTMEEKAGCQLASTHAALAAAEVVERVHSCVGTAGIRNDQPFQRHLRDAQVIRQHAFLAEARLEAVGQIRFGLEPDWGFFYF